MTRFITLLIGWLLLPIAMIVVAWKVAINYVEDKVDD